MKLIIPVHNLHRYIIINIIISFISNTPRIFINHIFGGGVHSGTTTSTWKICLRSLRDSMENYNLWTNFGEQLQRGTRHQSKNLIALRHWQSDRLTDGQTDGQREVQWDRQLVVTVADFVSVSVSISDCRLCPVETFINEQRTVLPLPPPLPDSLLKNVKIVKNSIRICCKRK